MQGVGDGMAEAWRCSERCGDCYAGIGSGSSARGSVLWRLFLRAHGGPAPFGSCITNFEGNSDFCHF